MWIFKIIKKETLEKMEKAHNDLMGKYENLHRLHKALWQKYQKEQQEADERINDLEHQLRKMEQDRNKWRNKAEKKQK